MRPNCSPVCGRNPIGDAVVALCNLPLQHLGLRFVADMPRRPNTLVRQRALRWLCGYVTEARDTLLGRCNFQKAMR
ncbi:hypothetical protein V7S43_009546 [Phytophthora oleae]|uniref:Uncharacterized protein n=1 Tax=Phytophthora oleae TaxID=2107226 RepID=A0ABD3FGG9_9STRA